MPGDRSACDPTRPFDPALDHPGPEMDAEIARLREEFFAAMGEPADISNAENFRNSNVLNFQQGRPRRRAA